MSTSKVSTAPRRYSLADLSTVAYATSVGGIYRTSALATPIFPVGHSLVAMLWPFGKHATAPNNKDFKFRIWMAWTLIRNDDHPDPGVMLMFYGEGQATLSNGAKMVGIETVPGAISTTENLADTLTFTLASDATTPKGPATIFETALSEGNEGVFSPGADTPAVLVIPTMGRCNGLYIEVDADAGSAPVDSANFLVSCVPA